MMTRDELIDTVASRCYLDPDQILSAIRAIEAAGMKIVERRPTVKMMGAGRGAFTCVGIFCSMFDAAPKFGDEP